MNRPRITHFDQDTWLEPEEYTYPSGGFHRRAKALCADGKVRTFKCAIPDTFFSIPARAKIKGKYTKGYLHIEDNVLKFREHTANR